MKGMLLCGIHKMEVETLEYKMIGAYDQVVVGVDNVVVIGWTGKKI